LCSYPPHAPHPYLPLHPPPTPALSTLSLHDALPIYLYGAGNTATSAIVVYPSRGSHPIFSLASLSVMKSISAHPAYSHYISLSTRIQGIAKASVMKMKSRRLGSPQPAASLRQYHSAVISHPLKLNSLSG